MKSNNLNSLKTFFRRLTPKLTLKSNHKLVGISAFLLIVGLVVLGAVLGYKENYAKDDTGVLGTKQAAQQETNNPDFVEPAPPALNGNKTIGVGFQTALQNPSPTPQPTPQPQPTQDTVDETPPPNEGDPDESSSEETELQFETIAKGSGGHSEKVNYLIENDSDWEELWEKVNSLSISKPPSPEVDFTQNSIIAIFQGMKSTGGYSIEIIKVVETENSVEVFIKEVSPGENCIVTQAFTQPHHIIKTKKIDKKVNFTTEQEIKDC